MVYNNYIEKLANKIEARLIQIEAIFGFDLGDEYEIAVCQLLTDILPTKFGVCRGFIVASDNTTVGDDIIIYDRLAYPTIRSLTHENFSLKEQVPAEAVYAYLECKHKLTPGEAGSFLKGITQVTAAKRFLMSRESVINPAYHTQYHGKDDWWPHPFPRLKNQPFGALISRQVDPSLSIDNLNRMQIGGDDTTPDLIVLGKDIIMTPTAVLGPDGFKSALFYDSTDHIPLRAEFVNGLAMALGITALLFALSWIELRPIQWEKILNEAFWYAPTMTS